MTKVTLIMVINSEKFHEKMIQNILKNTVYDFELICVKRCFPKFEINIKDSRVSIKESEDNNLMQTLNESIVESNGRFLIFTNSLNILLDDTLKRGYYKLEKSSADLLLFSNKTKESTIISRITHNQTFNYQKIREHIFAANYSINNILYDKNYLINKDIQFNTERSNDSDLFTYKSILNADKIYSYNKPLNIHEKTNITSSIEYEENLEILKDIREIIYEKQDKLLKSEVNNYMISKSIIRYDKINYNDKKEAYNILKRYYNDLLFDDGVREFVDTLTGENRKNFEQILITENIEEYELLKKVYRDKKHVNFMKRYEKILKAEHNKISDFNRSLLASNSWQLTRFLRIGK